MPLFIDRLPFHRWVDATRTPPTEHWTIILPVVLAEPTLAAPPAGSVVREWAFDTGNRGEAFAWRHHIIQAGMDPDIGRMPVTLTARTVSGRLITALREAGLWLFSNVPALAGTPYRVPLLRGLAFNDVPNLPGPQYQRPLVGIRAMRTARLRVEMDFTADTISVWTPDVP